MWTRLVLALAIAALGITAQQAPAAHPGEDALFQDMPVVVAASLRSQTLQEAPASVTVITAADIRKYGYRTLAEALASVRGFYLTYDHMYHYVGIRGFSLPGDYNTRSLVMLNGHPLTENVYSSNGFFGQDFGLDMDLVERIEIIRGPTSALYGSNGMIANINVVTKSPVDAENWRVSVETGSFGEKKALASGTRYLGGGANLLVSSSVFNNAGADLHIPNAPGAERYMGQARGVDGERGYHTFANLIWRDWNFVAYFNSREKHVPLTWSEDAVFADPGDRALDARNLVGATYTRSMGSDRELRWNLYFNQYRYRDRVDYEDDFGVFDVRTTARADWLDSQLRYQTPLSKNVELTFGAQVAVELQNLQYDWQAAPTREDLLWVDRPDRTLATFGQAEWQVRRRWKVYGGLRFDSSARYRDAISPRIALVYEASPATAYKFVYGRPFRNPSAYEQYYEDNGVTAVAAGPLRAETAHTFEVSVERKLSRALTVILNAYHYRLRDLIEADYLDGGISQFRNTSRARSTGFEAELTGKPYPRLESAMSWTYQRAAAYPGATELTNSPRHLAKVRAGTPLARNALFLSGSVLYMSSRCALSAPQVGGVMLFDATLSTNRVHSRFDLAAGIRNAVGRKYEDPVGLSVDRLQNDGRSVFLKLIWHATTE